MTLTVNANDNSITVKQPTADTMVPFGNGMTYGELWAMAAAKQVEAEAKAFIEDVIS